MEEYKELLDNLIEQAESYVRRNYSRDSKMIKLIGRIKAVLLVSNLKEDLLEWIPVEDKLPDDGEKVLVTYRLGVTIASYNSGIWIPVGRTRKLKSVTAWRELPEPHK